MEHPGLEHVGPYRVGPIIGVGGYSTVYLGSITSKALRRRGAQSLPHRVAIKVFNEFKDWERNVQDELHIGTRLRGDRFVRAHRLYNVRGYTCMVMEFVSGIRLDELLRNETCNRVLHPLVATKLLQSLCVALSNFWELRDGSGRRLYPVHNDLKPANLMVTVEGRVKLMDFGAVTFRGMQYEAPFGLVKGTPSYMSPEQARALVRDHRSDVFTIGTILFTIVTGEFAFTGRSMKEILYKIFHLECEKQIQLVERISPELSKILVGCWVRDPHLRFSSARQIGYELTSAQRSIESRLEGQYPPTIRTLAEAQIRAESK